MLPAALFTPPDIWCQIVARFLISLIIELAIFVASIVQGVQNQLGLTSEERLMLANLRVRAAPKNSYYRLDGSDPRESDGELLVLEWESRAPKSRVILLEIGPATGLAPSDIRSMVRSLVICLTHASEVRGAAKVNAQPQL
ncbi:unnamed protein product [Microthlaspi erraticum]|uniref:Uncharacterized protein n=1 Tax=Microthlaspi erraticum TaxID=1685480 RepID=A0A6D2JU32_9BRAS|nr:unnamed protein product [Microthlaspi erraticum]